jgi:hypothetical protein
MQSPKNAGEENIFTSLANEYLDNREKDWREKWNIQRVWNWTFAIVCFACICLCGYGVTTFISWNNTWNSFIAHETAMSERREQREIVKARRDSIMASIYFKQVK